MILFSVSCTTCRAKLSVKNVAAIGQILACPKCGGMVQVLAPPGWQPPAENEIPSNTPASQSSGLKAEDSKSECSGIATQAASSKSLPASKTAVSKTGVWSDVPTEAHGLDSQQPGAAIAAQSRNGRVLLVQGAIAAGIAAIVLLSGWGIYRWRSSSTESDAPVAQIATEAPAPAPVELTPLPATKEDPPANITETELSTFDKTPMPVESSRPSQNTASQPSETKLSAPVQTVVASSAPATAPQPAPSTAASPAATAPTAEPTTTPAKTDPPAVATNDIASTKPASPASAIGEQPLPVPKRLPPRDDINDRLADKLPEIELRDVPLVQGLRVLSQLSTLPISLDLQALAESNADLEARVSVKLSQATMAEILTALLAQQRLVFVVEEDQVLATNSERRQSSLRSEQYIITDISGIEPLALGELVQQFVAPSSWQLAGGQGKLYVNAEKLVIEQTVTVHRQVQTFLDRLRVARGKLIPSPLSAPSDISLRYAATRGKMAQTISVNFHDDTPLAQIVEYLEQVSGLRIVLDLPALAQVGVAGDSPFSLAVERQPLSATLASLLEPRGLTYRFHNDRTLQITSIRAARQQLEAEVFKITELVTAASSAETLVEQIKANVSPASWRESGGAGVISIDNSVPSLIVLQSQAVQLEVQAFLDKLRAATRQR